AVRFDRRRRRFFLVEGICGSEKGRPKGNLDNPWQTVDFGFFLVDEEMVNELLKKIIGALG
ncbi:hypothetical protein L195_g058527, partial [Trifolium pratense]